MNRLLSLAAVLLLAFGAVADQAQSHPSDRDRLIGAWSLVELDQASPDGKAYRVECSGLFVFTRDGHASVQVMDDEPNSHSTAAAGQYSQGGYEASYGTYAVNERTHTFTFHLEGALVRSLVGKELARSYQFSGNRLIVKSAHADEHWTAIWEHD